MIVKLDGILMVAPIFISYEQLRKLYKKMNEWTWDFLKYNNSNFKVYI